MNIVERLREEIKGRGCPQFASFTYVAKPSGSRLTEEKARHVVLLGADLEELYRKDVEVLRALTPSLDGLRLQAAMQLLESREESLSKGIGENDAATSADSYITLDCPGLKVHLPTGNVHVMGLKVSKVVLVEANYRTVKSKPLTIEKDAVRKLLPSSRLRQFCLANETVVRINHQTLEFGK